MAIFRDWRVAVAFFLALCFWASAFAAIRVAVRQYSPEHVALLRFLTASGVLLLCAPFFKVRRPEARDWPGLALMGFCGVFVYHTLLNRGERTVTAGSAAFLINTSPIFTAILAGIILGETLTARQKLGVAISFGGAVLIAFGEKSGPAFSGDAFLILVAAFSSAVYIVLQKHFLARYRAFELTAWGFWLGTAMLLIFAPGLVWQMRAASPAATGAVIYAGIFPGAMAYVIWALVIQKTNASTGASLLYAIPFLSLVIAWILLREAPSTPALIGGFIALLGVIVVNFRRSKAAPLEA